MTRYRRSRRRRAARMLVVICIGCAVLLGSLFLVLSKIGAVPGDTINKRVTDNGTLNARIDGATATATMSTYTDKNRNTKYVDKILPSSLTLSKNHAVKEIS